MERTSKSKELKHILILICLMLIASLLNLNATTFKADGDVVVVHVDAPKSLISTSKP
ncbi:hypothetical protein JHU38_06260 [Prevotella sp. A2931]|uniref:Uncharacterized protein n=1 Tax=Prevotella illustrans TaxID=2800387 RepID=A0ABS3M5J3_9BACT|nr:MULTISPECIES: hypothetical protein [Prevotella]MBO1363380.1 hypothetical protein [Prevotella illustrans]